MTIGISDGRYFVRAARTLVNEGRTESARRMLQYVLEKPQDLPTLRELQDLGRLLRKDQGDEFRLERWIGYLRPFAETPRCLTILDEISEVNWSADFNCIRLNRTADNKQFREETYDFILIESAWIGNDSDWIYAFTSSGLEHPHSKILVSKLIYLRENLDKPIIMVNKEDPMHFEKFLPIMKYADHIFTTGEEMVECYRQQTSAMTVTAMPFAADMTLTNPVGRIDEPQENLCFAGSYYGQGHDERVRQMNYLLEPITTFNGVIYDRQSANEDPIYRFPERFAPNIRPSVSFRTMAELYRRFRVFLNVNTIVSSPTMMARRVYELLACGTPVVSTPSRAMEEQFSGIVPIASNAAEACREVERLLADESHWWKTSQKGIREIALKHQYKHRAALMRSVVWGNTISDYRPLVSILITLDHPLFLNRIIECVHKQTYPRTDAIFSVREDIPAEELERIENRLKGAPHIEQVTFLRHPIHMPLGTKMEAAISAARGEFFAVFDDRNWYLPNYLTDMILTFEFSNADVTGKSSHPVWQNSGAALSLTNPANQHKMTSYLNSSTLVGYTSWMRKLLPETKDQANGFNILQATIECGAKLYSADHFNFISFQQNDMTMYTEAQLFSDYEKLLASPQLIGEWTV